MAEFVKGMLMFLAYVAPLGVILLLIRKFTKIPDELFRKALHFVLLGAYIPLLFTFETWWICFIFVCSLGVVLFPVLKFAGKIKGFSAFVNERKGGEFTSSMVLAVGVMADRKSVV